MARKFSVEREFYLTSPVTITVKTNGAGTVVVSSEHDKDNDEWVADSTIDADGAYEVSAYRKWIKISPVDGATYCI